MVKIKQKKGWIKIVEAFMAISMLLIILFIIIDETNVREDYTKLLEKRNIEILGELQTNQLFRGEILDLSLPSTEDSLSKELKGYLDETIPPGTSYSIQICTLTGPCEMAEEVEQDIYSSEILIFANSTVYNPRKVKIYSYQNEI